MLISSMAKNFSFCLLFGFSTTALSKFSEELNDAWMNNCKNYFIQNRYPYSEQRKCDLNPNYKNKKCEKFELKEWAAKVGNYTGFEDAIPTPEPDYYEPQVVDREKGLGVTVSDQDYFEFGNATESPSPTPRS